MDVKKIFVNTYKYDFHFAKICIASIRYWYPDIPVFLIKEYNAGNFDTSVVERNWNVKVLDISRKKFGWGYGKLEPLFLETGNSFLVLDADTVITGPVLDQVKSIPAAFIVDDEVQPAKRFNEIYYNLNRVQELEKNFKYPGYSFNSGQWFGTSGVVTRQDFDKSLEWSEPPRPKFPDIVFNGDQAHLNFVLHWLEQTGKTTVSRIKLMIWPTQDKADFINLTALKERKSDYPFVIHWAGMKFKKITDLPRADIISFYRNYYYSKSGGASQQFIDEIEYFYLARKKKLNLLTKKILKRMGSQ